MHNTMPHLLFVRRASVAGFVLLATACGGDAPEEQTQAANAEQVDQSSSATATEKELTDFRAPADSVLTEAQVQAYLKTTLVAFDLVRQEIPQYHQKLAQVSQRAEKNPDGLVAGLRNLTDATTAIAGWGDLVGGSFARSARSLGYNPAEMEWVRERMSEVSVALAMRPMHEMTISAADASRQLAAQYRSTPGFDEAQIQEMLRNADESEKNAREQMNGSRSVSRNMEVLRRARPNVTDHMWTAVAFAGGASGLLGLTGLADPNDTTAVRTMNEWRRIYTDALADKVTPGLEANVPAAEARPRLEAAPASN
jgi:ElaB/YqjD/DUF883 family membrane-anchored ribosome-binding protein